MTPDNGQSSNQMTSKQAFEKISSISEKVGRPLRVFVNPAILPVTEKSETEGASSSKETNQIGGEESDDFYEFTPADYARLQSSRKEEKFLKTKYLREQDEAAARNRITKAIIRIQFPDEWILEADFRPSDLISTVRDFVTLCLKQKDLPFYFYTTPPKQKLKDETLSLYSSGLVPGAIIHFSPETISEKDKESSTNSTYLQEEIEKLRDLHLLSNTEEEGNVQKENPKESSEIVKPSPPISSSSASTSKSKGKPKWFKG